MGGTYTHRVCVGAGGGMDIHTQGWSICVRRKCRWWVWTYTHRGVCVGAGGGWDGVGTHIATCGLGVRCRCRWWVGWSGDTYGYVWVGCQV